MSLWYLTFYIVFPKIALFINSKKSFSKSFLASVLNLIFISMYGFKRASWLNWIILCTFFRTNPWFNACFNDFIWRKFFSLSLILQKSLLHFLIFILTDKNGKSLRKFINFLDTQYLLQEYILYHYLHHNFFLKSSSNLDTFFSI